MANVIMVILVVLFLFLSQAAANVFDTKTCRPVEDPVTYVLYKLQCKYGGPGLYSFTGPETVKTLEVDRLTEESHLVITSSTLQSVTIKKGTCSLVSAPLKVKVTVDGKLCNPQLSLFTRDGVAQSAAVTTSMTSETTDSGTIPTDTTMDFDSLSHPQEQSSQHQKLPAQFQSQPGVTMEVSTSGPDQLPDDDTTDMTEAWMISTIATAIVIVGICCWFWIWKCRVRAVRTNQLPMYNLQRKNN